MFVVVSKIFTQYWKCFLKNAKQEKETVIKCLLLNHQQTQKLKLMGEGKFNIMSSSSLPHEWVWNILKTQRVKINISWGENNIGYMLSDTIIVKSQIDPNMFLKNWNLRRRKLSNGFLAFSWYLGSRKKFFFFFWRKKIQ